jgi:hypothetical protein
MNSSKMKDNNKIQILTSAIFGKRSIYLGPVGCIHARTPNSCYRYLSMRRRRPEDVEELLLLLADFSSEGKGAKRPCGWPVSGIVPPLLYLSASASPSLPTYV